MQLFCCLYQLFDLDLADQVLVEYTCTGELQEIQTLN